LHENLLLHVSKKIQIVIVTWRLWYTGAQA
jgi:hypothetical protein